MEISARKIATLLVVSLAVFSSAIVHAQDAASIAGTVTDASGAVVPGAKIVLANKSANLSYQAESNATGSYTISNIAPGPGYTETVSHGGFQTIVLTGLYLNVGTTRSQNVRLAVGTVSTTVSVSAENQEVTLDTTDAAVGNNFQVQYLQDLPVMARDSPMALMMDQPGMTTGGTSGGGSMGGGGGTAGSSTGARVDQDRVTLDGLDVNDELYGSFGKIVGNAPVDSVQEFRGTTAGMLSSSGAGGGGQFELVTKSGTNHFHGDLNEYHRDTDLEANEWFNNFEGVPRSPLVRNQYGGAIGGPIWRNKAYFFFDFNGRHDSLSTIAVRTVPMDSFLKDQTIGYYTDISTGTTKSVNATAVQGFDPQGVGFDQAMFSFLTGKCGNRPCYPSPNDFSGDAGDLVNTAGYRFNAPKPYIEKNYVGRVDLDPFRNHHLFGRVTYNNINSVNNPVQFPGDPETFPSLDKSHAWVVGWDWTIGNNKTNSVIVGNNIAKIGTPDAYNPQGANQYNYDGDPTGGYFLSGPYANANGQTYYFPIPVVRDDFNWEKGRHGFSFGGSFKYPSPHYSEYGDYNGPIVGLGGGVTGLPTNGSTSWNFDPSDIDNSQTSLTVYQSALVLALGRFEDTNDTWNYTASGSVVPQGGGLQTEFRYFETELYFGDTWKATPSLTVTYGVRYQNFTVPYEIHGIQADQNLSFWDFMNARVAQSKDGVGGPASLPGGTDAVPYVEYNLAGKANHAAPYYQPDNKDFAPRVAFAWTPTADRKLVINGGAGIIYDETVVNAILQEEAVYSYLFESSGTSNYGVPATLTNSAAYNSLQQNTRFSALSSPPPGPTPPAITKPDIPFVGPESPECSSPGPCGLANGGAFNISVDHNLPTPYNIMFNLGIQQEFSGGFLFRLGYVGRLGRHLLAQADAEQLIDFPDSKSGQKLSQAMAALTTWLRQNPNAPLSSVPAQPFFENVLYPNGTGVTNTAFIAANMAPYPARGDVADSVELMSYYGLLPANVGMAAQLSENTFFTDLGFSAYHGLLATLHKNGTHGLQFDLNYTWSHSIDNTSQVANSEAYTGYGFVCDVLRPRLCRGNSDFDETQVLNGNVLYQLPFGRGRTFLTNVPLWADEVVGGWELSGLPSYHTGTPYMANSIAFLMSYSNEDPAILTGSLGGIQKAHVTVGSDGIVSTFKNPETAFNQWSGPVGFEMGSRNNLRGPGFFDADLGLGKTFPIYPSEGVTLKFRCDAFNAFNHPNFQTPSFQNNMDLTSPPNEFGAIPGTVTPAGADLSARVLQGSLRLEF
jgi:Carboxypeptidase regulatory-like domain